ncbi:MAG: stage III sporulation protein AA [Ruminococcaceae bacterium]|nr:stage III sporulation protein AA [Oscillospiraceae bacterium]
MDEWEKVIAVLPCDIQEELRTVSPAIQGQVGEIRFRLNAPLLLTGADIFRRHGKRIYTAEDMYRLFSHLCAHSVYAHQEEIRRGYIATANGCRAGVAGHAVIENGQVVSMRDITSVCLRLAREHRGCAMPLLPYLYRGNRLQSVLICGGPAGGKTTLLRDLIRTLSCDKRRPAQLTVVDERGELTATFEKTRPFDVLGGFSKAQGIEQALRTLSPEGIVFDELGGEEDAAALARCVHSGVATLGSVHAEDVSALQRRVALRPLLESGCWDIFAVMRGRQAPGEIAKIVTAEEVVG